MTIGIIGNGIVGGCLVQWFTNQGQERKVHDSNPERSLDSLAEVLSCDLIFICIFLPNNATGLDELGVLQDLLRGMKPGTIVALRSTVYPGTTGSLQVLFPDLKLCFVPEFLTEANAWEDFLAPWIQIVGGPVESASSIINILPWAETRVVVTTRQAEWIKLATAGFLSTKISWFNQLYDALGPTDYREVTEVLANDIRLGLGYMNVHQDGYRGWAGKCFTKDTPCFAEASGMPLMKEVVKYNEELKNAQVESRERAAPISETVD